MSCHAEGGFCFKSGDFYHIAAIEARRKDPAALPPVSSKFEKGNEAPCSKLKGIKRNSGVGEQNLMKNADCI